MKKHDPATAQFYQYKLSNKMSANQQLKPAHQPQPQQTQCNSTPRPAPAPRPSQTPPQAPTHNRELQQLRSEVSQLRAELAESKQTIAALEASSDVARDDFMRKLDDKTQAQKRETELQAQLKAANQQEQSQAAQALLDARDNEIAALRGQIAALQEEVEWEKQLKKDAIEEANQARLNTFQLRQEYLGTNPHPDQQ